MNFTTFKRKIHNFPTHKKIDTLLKFHVIILNKIQHDTFTLLLQEMALSPIKSTKKLLPF